MMFGKVKIFIFGVNVLVLVFCSGGVGQKPPDDTELEKIRQAVLDDPVMYELRFESAFAEHRALTREVKKQVFGRLAIGLEAYLSKRYYFALDYLEKCGQSRHVKELFNSGFSVKIQDLIQRCIEETADSGCTECGGSTMVDCGACSGSGWKICRRCKGNGKVMEVTRTPGLRRRGAELKGIPVLCYQCRGLLVNKCDTCSGSGLVECPNFAGRSAGSARLLYDPSIEEIKKIMAISVYLSNGGIDVYSNKEILNSPVIAKSRTSKF